MKPILKGIIFASVIGIGCWLVVSNSRNGWGKSDKGGRVWFYDESEKKLYLTPDTIIPPDKGIGGPAGDGEKAVVVTFGKNWHDRSKWRIAYLQKYTPDLKKTLEKVMIARAARRVFEGTIPSPLGAYFQTNTLVKRVDDPDWYPANSDEGRKILTEWRSWLGTDGSSPVVCPAN